ncbi:MAG TPA: hypothetical protein VJL88_06215 [Nitrospira sp.]|nr:hypothetical protein [Nitrospira sp.]
MTQRIWRPMIFTVGLVVALNGYGEGAGLPDILGIQLGMPAREAHAKLQAQLPKNVIQVMSTNLPTIEKPVITSFESSPKQPLAMGDEGDQVMVAVTLPPNKQAVWRVDRNHSFPGKGIPKSTLLASLREKYGKETLTNVQQGKPASNDNQIATLLWIYDEAGRPAPPPSSGNNLANVILMQCIGAVDGHIDTVEVYMNNYKGKNAQADWCYSSYTAVYATVMESNPPELYSHMRLVIASLPFAARASEATSKWKKGIAEGQHRQDLEKAKQQEKPKL